MPTWNVCCVDINTGEIRTFKRVVDFYKYQTEESTTVFLP